MSFEDLTRAQLLELLEEHLANYDRRSREASEQADEQTRVIAELQLYQVELEIQNRELRRAQNELEESRDRYGELFELAPIAYLALDDSGQITSVNQPAATLLRSKREVLLGVSLVERCGGNNQLAGLLARSAQQQRRVTAEALFEIEGEQIEVEVIATCSIDERGRSSYRCALLDVTERKRAVRERDRALASERSLHACFQALDRIHLEVDTAFTKRADAAALSALFSDAIVQLFGDVQVDIHWDGSDFGPRASVVQGTMATIEAPLSVAGKRRGTLRVALDAERPAQYGQTIADYCRTLELIADRLALALELARLHAAEADERRRLLWLDRARHLLTNAHDPDEVLHAIEACFEDAVGVAASAGFAWEHDRWMPIGKATRYTRLLGHWLAKEAPSERQSLHGMRFPRIARAVMCDHVLVLPLHARDRTLGFLCFALPEGEHAELRRALEELSYMAAAALDTTQLVRELRGAVDARDTLLALVAHDLRSPLNAISLTASSLSEPPPHAERRSSAPQFQLIQRSIQRMSHLIEDLLTAANIDSGNFAVDDRPLPAEELVFEAAALDAPAAEARQIKLEASCPEDFGRVWADRERVLQVFTNLIVNALKFSPQGSRVQLIVERQGEYARFCVRDDGPGMSAEQAAHIFRRYWRGNGKRAGLGLGLFIAERIVNAHHGRIWVESEPERGAAFYFTLPIVQRVRATAGTAVHSS